jgi:hypothetical protein
VKEDNDEDVLLAMKLLRGDLRGWNNERGEPANWPPKSSKDLPTLVFLSKKTTPTEEDARRALCRVLRSRTEKPSGLILEALANLFDPDASPGGYPQRKAVLKMRGRGHSDVHRDLAIAETVFRFRVDGMSYHKAVERVAIAIGKSDKHVERICGKFKSVYSLSRWDMKWNRSQAARRDHKGSV